MESLKNLGHRIKETSKTSSSRRNDLGNVSTTQDCTEVAKLSHMPHKVVRPRTKQQVEGLETRTQFVTVPSALSAQPPQQPPRPTRALPTIDVNKAGPLPTNAATKDDRIPTQDGITKDEESRRERTDSTTTTATKTVREELLALVTKVLDRDEELEQVLRERSKRIKYLEDQLYDLERSAKERQLEVIDLVTQLKKTEEKNTELIQGWNQTTVALRKAQFQNANHKIDDKALQALYQELVFVVGNWAENYCGADLSNLPGADLAPFSSLTGSPELYLRHKRSQPLLLRSLVMKMLVDFVLRVSPQNGLWWAGDCHEGMRSLFLALQLADPQDIPDLLSDGTLRLTDVKSFSQWKAKSAILMSESVEEVAVEKNIHALVARWKQTLAPLVIRNKASIWEELENVIRKAIELDLEMKKSRALFTVHCWSVENFGMLDPAIIETPVGCKVAHPGLEVELILAPSLSKTGNADGDAFEMISYLSNWTVIGTENREAMKRVKPRGS